MFMDIDTFRLAVFLSGLALMFVVETLWPSRPWADSRRSRFFLHTGLMIFNTVILRFSAVVPLLAWRKIVYANGWGIGAMLGLNGALGIAVTIVLFDLFDYWWHRFNHRVPFLWRFHKVHHVDTHVDVTTSLRFHPGELMISSVVKAVWILIWGPSLWSFVIFETATTSASQFHHSNLDFPDIAEFSIRKIVVTPRFHASHHTVKPRTGNANFSPIFIFWDKVFGTYREPSYEEMRELGLARGRETYLSLGTTLKGPFTSQY